MFMTVFTQDYADQYDRMYSHKDYEAECTLIENAFSRFGTARPQTILDVGCGTGSHALELSRRGFAVTGVDRSSHMLARAAEKARELEPAARPQWVCGDMAGFHVPQHYDSCIAMFAVLGYATTNDDVLSVLRNIRRHLKSNGLFICDFWYGPAVLAMRPSERVRVADTEDGWSVRTSTTKLDTTEQTAEVTMNLWSISRGKEPAHSVELHKMRFFFAQEISLLLSVAGFKLAALRGFPSLDDLPSENNWNALVVAHAVS
jgi:ubiquinone/menaquinone biosynthesis C-methylase UbiE